MLSATTADSRLSMAANSATVTADGNSGMIRSRRISGKLIAGNPVGMPPNRLPIVSTLIPNTVHTTVATSKVTIVPGTRVVIRGQETTPSNDASATPTDQELKA